MNRKTLARAFAAALPHIRDGHIPYICWALDQAVTCKKISRSAADSAKKVIADRIGGYALYEGWMIANNPGLYEEARCRDDSRTKAREGRVAWLNSLIQEFLA